jgi:hypothetical protein
MHKHTQNGGSTALPGRPGKRVQGRRRRLLRPLRRLSEDAPVNEPSPHQPSFASRRSATAPPTAEHEAARALPTMS